ncbi:deoxyuridine 5'-triphosphate nucleotidohydrolase [Halococcoides cellulosivorans]|uniref:Deoxyuridine 5'-triphosphate nucleotidohydrolase n=1 Tax=Halococcoides cellulosivorans TaxID=1679096 RepID=A0A2R4X092_9EURY|nr:deoxyuridine 5'-triphosphate nucleotidohydrolase [Halococcoides cellulosivorans]AWB27214.1 deoxyuridine 5'-triphosphate nucleotidohydrolase [Halococcoides cellulosivorans]
MFESGAFVAEQFGDLTDEQVQPNGVDLRIEGVFEPDEPGRIGVDGKHVAERREIEPRETDGRAVYHLDPGGYVVTYEDRIAIPDEHVGLLLPRSSLLRNGATLETAVWDAGYEGRGEGLLIAHHPIEIERGARIGQLIVAEAEHSGTYDGSYQGERIEADGGS